MTLQTVCPTLYNGVNTTVGGIANCYAGALFGLDYTIFCFLALGAVAFMAYKFRFPANVSLAIAFSVVYFFDIASGGGNYILELLLALLGIGLAIMIVTGLLDYARNYS